MTPQRTGGMTAIGVLNIVFGCLGCLTGLLALVGTGLLTAFGAAASNAGEPNAGGAMATAGIFGMVLSVAFLVSSGCLLYGGIGVLKVAPFGRKFSLIAACTAIALTVVTVLMTGFSISLSNVIVLAYCGFVTYMCMTPQWKQAFSGHGTMTQSNNYNRDYRAAA